MFAIDRIALDFARRVEDRQPRADYGIPQLPAATPAPLTDLIPFFHTATGNVSQSTLAAAGIVAWSTLTGTAIASATARPLIGSVTAVGSTTAVTLPVAFSTVYVPVVYDVTAGAFVTTGFTAFSLSGFTFASTNAHVYTVIALGY